MCLNRRAFWQGLGVNAVSSSKTGCNSEFVTIYINGKYSGGSSHFSSLQIKYVIMKSIAAIKLTWMTAKPTAPKPNTATDDPASTLQVFQTAPRPVLHATHKVDTRVHQSPNLTPHPNRQILSSGAASLIFAQEISLTTVYSENVEQPMKW
jgi:hypothetical protein